MSVDAIIGELSDEARAEMRVLLHGRTAGFRRRWRARGSRRIRHR
jgi:hypothetical protein